MSYLLQPTLVLGMAMSPAIGNLTAQVFKGTVLGALLPSLGGAVALVMFNLRYDLYGGNRHVLKSAFDLIGSTLTATFLSQAVLLPQRVVTAFLIAFLWGNLLSLLRRGATAIVVGDSGEGVMTREERVAEEPSGQTDSLSVFLCYSHDDERWRERIALHLQPLERSGQVEVWSDRKITPGSRWREEIEAALKRADAAVLLVSAAFLASSFIHFAELPRLLAAEKERGLVIYWFLVSPCDYAGAVPVLADIQAVNDPGTPLARMSKAERDEAFTLLAKRLRTSRKRAGGR